MITKIDYTHVLPSLYNTNEDISLILVDPNEMYNTKFNLLTPTKIRKRTNNPIKLLPLEELTQEPVEQLIEELPIVVPEVVPEVVDGKYYTYGWKGKQRPLTTGGRSFYLKYEFKSPLPIEYQYEGVPLISMDIQELFKKEGLTSINGKKVRLNKDRKNPRTWGKNKGSWHRTIDKDTGLVTAWDVSIVNGTLKDYDALAKAMIDNKHIYSWLALKGFGIFDEVRGTSTDKTGPHFHIGPDSGAQRDLYGFLKRFAPHYLKQGGSLISKDAYRVNKRW